jgi:type I restriction enzyme M protein
MKWIAPTRTDDASTSLETRLWEAADQLRANSGLTAREYSGPILCVMFLRFAKVRYATQRARLERVGASSRRGSRAHEPAGASPRRRHPHGRRRGVEMYCGARCRGGKRP